MGWLPPFIPGHGDRQQSPDDAAVLSYIALFQPVVLAPPRDQIVDQLEIGLQIVGMGEFLEIKLRKLFRGIAEQARNRADDPPPDAIGGDKRVYDRRVIEEDVIESITQRNTPGIRITRQPTTGREKSR